MRAGYPSDQTDTHGTNYSNFIKFTEFTPNAITPWRVWIHTCRYYFGCMLGVAVE